MNIKLKDCILLIKKELRYQYPDNEIRNFSYLIFEHLMDFSRTDFLVNQDAPIQEAKYRLFKNIIDQLKDHKPIQYILGKTTFYGLKFYVDPNVLIPRPETEELVDRIIKQAGPGKLKILDIGAGSGCIAVSLAKNLPGAEVDALDISENALILAAKNAAFNEVKVNFYKYDILQWLPQQVGIENANILAAGTGQPIPSPENSHEQTQTPSTGNSDAILTEPATPVHSPEFEGKKYDVIVSNPPYVRESDKAFMMPNVLNYEPAQALFVQDENPLVFYEAIGRFALKHIEDGGKIFVEINENLATETVEKFKNTGFSSVALKKDLNGKNRIVIAQL